MNDGSCIFEKSEKAIRVKNQNKANLGEIRLANLADETSYRFFPHDDLRDGIAPLDLARIAGYAEGLWMGKALPETASAHHV